MSEHAVQDPDAEREVDLRSAWTRITARWYLPVAGLLIGAVLGVLASVGSGDTFRAPDAPLPRPAVHDLGRRPDPEPRDEPGDGEPDHPLGGRAASRRGGERAHARPAARQRHLDRPSSRPARRRNVSPLVEITVNAPRRAQGGEGGERARRVRRSASSPPTSTRRSTCSTSRSHRAGPSSRTSTSGSRTPSRSSSR